MSENVSRALPRSPRRDPLRRSDAGPHVDIAMGGPNILIRSSVDIDREYTTALAHAINAAADTGTVVVIDPESIRYDTALASAPLPSSEIDCAAHAACRPVEVEVAGSGIIRIVAEHGCWLVDVAHGRYCRTDQSVDACFIDSESWTDVVAVYVTPTIVRALTADGMLVSGARAHDVAPPLLAG